jgi:hypothetical protein
LDQPLTNGLLAARYVKYHKTQSMSLTDYGFDVKHPVETVLFTENRGHYLIAGRGRA